MIVWTVERVAELKSHWENGLSAEESASKLGATRNAIAGKRNRIGLRDQMRLAHPPKSREGMKARNIQKAVVRQVQRPRVRMVLVSYHKLRPRLPEMSKTALREMLRCAVENTW